MAAACVATSLAFLLVDWVRGGPLLEASHGFCFLQETTHLSRGPRLPGKDNAKGRGFPEIPRMRQGGTILEPEFQEVV